MEFKAIVDAKARDPSGCAVVGVYENGDLGVGRPLDRHASRRADRASCTRSGDFAAQTRRHPAVAAAAGRCAARILLVGLGARAAFVRKQYRKALQSSAQALAKTGASDAIVYLALEAGRRTRRCSTARASSPRCSARRLTRFRTSRPARSPKRRDCATVRVAAADARAAKCGREGSQHRRCDRQRRWHSRGIWRICRRTFVRPLISDSAPRLGQGMAAASRPRCWTRAASRP